MNQVNDRDYAVVVGISRYPRFGLTVDQANDLSGPDRDAVAIHDWLVDPAGGSVPPDNIRCVRSGTYANPFPRGKVAPRAADVIRTFRWLDDLAEQNDGQGLGRVVGRRLYLYVGGHGFGRDRLEGALFMANATIERPSQLEATMWAKWFQKTSYFDEYVVWVDCCMRPEARLEIERAGFRVASPTASADIFQAFGARFPLFAVEAPMEDGQVHGAFTWALLKGLRGAAADPSTGTVTTSGLMNYLVNAMQGFMTPGQLADADVSKEPDFGPTDNLVLATVAPSTFTVQISFGQDLIGRPWRILTETLVEKAAGAATAGGATVSLPAGAYILQSSDQLVGFQVLGKEVAVHVG